MTPESHCSGDMMVCFQCSYYITRFNEVDYNDVIMSTMASQITSLTIVYSTIYSDADQRKHQSSVSLAFVRGIHRRPVNSPHKWPVMRKMFPFDDVIMYHIAHRQSFSCFNEYWLRDTTDLLIHVFLCMFREAWIVFPTCLSSPALDIRFNSLAPGRPGCHFKTAIFNLVLLISIFTSSNDNALKWMPWDLTNDKSTLVQVMAWCRQATSH